MYFIITAVHQTSCFLMNSLHLGLSISFALTKIYRSRTCETDTIWTTLTVVIRALRNYTKLGVDDLHDRYKRQGITIS